mmetsp:Transcript_16213/g.49290  ORF Transcript_16213/g.49290 Transcript_16213/m.49290 type:complete len:352 (+) Transcript_16213:2352-3407(+)|eukprot:scaffold239559_cov30-Tisochrysis_lutea.AAC.1
MCSAPSGSATTSAGRIASVRGAISGACDAISPSSKAVAPSFEVVTSSCRAVALSSEAVARSPEAVSPSGEAIASSTEVAGALDDAWATAAPSMREASMGAASSVPAEVLAPSKLLGSAASPPCIAAGAGVGAISTSSRLIVPSRPEILGSTACTRLAASLASCFTSAPTATCESPCAPNWCMTSSAAPSTAFAFWSDDAWGSSEGETQRAAAALAEGFATSCSVVSCPSQATSEAAADLEGAVLTATCGSSVVSCPSLATSDAVADLQGAALTATCGSSCAPTWCTTSFAAPSIAFAFCSDGAWGSSEGGTQKAAAALAGGFASSCSIVSCPSLAASEAVADLEGAGSATG